MAAGKMISGVDPTGKEVTIKVTESGEIISKTHGRNVQLHDAVANWGNSAAAGTANTMDIALPTDISIDNKYAIVVTNPSTETALTVNVLNKETFGSTVKYPKVTSFGVVANTPNGVVTVVDGWLLGEAGRLVITNDAATGLSGAFTAEVRIRKV